MQVYAKRVGQQSKDQLALTQNDVACSHAYNLSCSITSLNLNQSQHFQSNTCLQKIQC